MPDHSRVTECLAAFVTEARWDDLPHQVVHQTKRSFVNFFAVALTGCRDSTIASLLTALAEFSGGRQATVIGRRERIDAPNAALLNAAGSNVLDYCDTHTPTAIHPTAPLAPALLALAELVPVTGRDLLLAFALGQQVECRIGLAMSPSHYRKGWHITATCGVFGAAAGCGRLLGLDAQQMVYALALAATQAAGVCECLGTPAKSVGVGNAARNGLLAALLAARKIAGPAAPLEGAQGYYHALGETPDLARIVEGLGESWEILKTSYKPYPCGFVIHPVLDCVLDWRRDHPQAVVEKVQVTGNPLLAARADRPDIATGRESQVSVQHAVAAALLRGSAGIEQFGDACVGDPDIVALRRKVSVARDESFSTIAAAVAIETADGRVHKLAQNAARGSDSNPLSDRDLEEKLRVAAAGWEASHDIEQLIEALWQVDRSGNVANLAGLTVPQR